MSVLFVKNSDDLAHYGTTAVMFDDIMVNGASNEILFDENIVQGITHIVFAQKEVIFLQKELKQLHQLLENMGATSPVLHITTNVGSARPAQTLRDYLAK
ncbi:hypothetical protein HG440_002280 [Candidatus Saccharibacteria bacterium]|nr:hypothetical protein [Candidatus Saccharibacteria bacterium]